MRKDTCALVIGLGQGFSDPTIPDTLYVAMPLFWTHKANLAILPPQKRKFLQFSISFWLRPKACIEEIARERCENPVFFFNNIG
jgi:hypothetical protein